ncbi:MAG TPA: hypothetical protein PKE45_10560, partial [Caldilineaceae bacterium]|nr:hypothetical protein [Caldilineaceae bacterium]
MRLRYLRIADLPPLQSVSVGFGAQHVLERAYALHFVVGVNGSGKTQLLRALAQIFLGLERRQLPSFPCTLAYDLGVGSEARTILVHQPDPEERQDAPSAFIEFSGVLATRTLAEWEALAWANWRDDPPLRGQIRGSFLAGDLPGEGAINAYLPDVLIVYTSGALPRWQALFARYQRDDATAPLSERSAEGEEVGERPGGWTTQRENQLQVNNYLQELRTRLERDEEVRLTRGDLTLLEVAQEAAEINRTPSNAYLIDGDLLPLAVCAVALAQIVAELHGETTKEQLQAQIAKARADGVAQSGLRRLLNEIDWLWPESLHLRIRFMPEQWQRGVVERGVVQEMVDLYKLATTAIRQPAPSIERLLCFDLFRPLKEQGNRLTGLALFERVAKKYGGTPFAAFRQLVEWRNAGILVDVTLTV